MDDRTLVAAMVAGDPRGLDGAYRRYADRLHAYCRALLGDGDSAADAVHDTFVIASQRAGQLREPDRLRSWLYAIARHECLRHLRHRSRAAALDDADELRADTVDLAAQVQAEQLRALVAAAAAGLGHGDREVIDLAVRHGLSAADIGAVLGVATNHAHARLTRARGQLERALGALLVARAGAGRCPTLAGLLSGWDGQLTPLLRKRLSRHIDGCAACTAVRGEQLHPAALLGAYTGLPFAAVLAVAAGPGAGVAGTGAAGHDRQPGSDLVLDPGTGFPARPGRRRATALGVAAAVLLILVLIGTLAAPSRPRPAAAEPTPGPLPTLPVLPSPTGPVPTSPAPVSPGPASPAPAGTSPSGPGGTPSRRPTVSPSLRPPPPTPFTLRLTSGGVMCNSNGFSFDLRGKAAATGATLQSGHLFWKSIPSGVESVPATVQPSTLDGYKAGLRYPEIEWWVRGTATDGRVAETSHRFVTNPCFR